MHNYLRLKIKRFRRKVLRGRVILPFIVLFLIAGAISYAEYMDSRRLSLDTNTASPLLGLIGKIESNNNYNAHFGNGASKISFTGMTIAEVLEWQDDFVKSGSPSSAVGRYQIINDTLKSLVVSLGISKDQKFDENTQDRMAIELLKKRGVEQYVNEEITKKEFAANLAKEWAALPKMVGNNPDDSYYAGDGLNKARIKTNEVLKAIEPIAPEA